MAWPNEKQPDAPLGLIDGETGEQIEPCATCGKLKGHDETQHRMAARVAQLEAERDEAKLLRERDLKSLEWAMREVIAIAVSAGLDAKASMRDVAERVTSLRTALARVTGERDALQRHFDAAGPEHNLLALLDLYFDQRRDAQAERDAALARATKAEAERDEAEGKFRVAVGDAANTIVHLRQELKHEQGVAAENLYRAREAEAALTAALDSLSDYEAFARTYRGGHDDGEALDAFRHGMATVCNTAKRLAAFDAASGGG